MVTCTGHIGIHEGADGRTYVRTLYVRTDVHDVMAKFSHIDGLPYFLKYGAPRARSFGARGAPLLCFCFPTKMLHFNAEFFPLECLVSS